MRASWFRAVAGAMSCVVVLCPSFHATLIPPYFMDSVVVIGRNEVGPLSPKGVWIPEASGFLYGEFLSKQDDQHSTYSVYLVTNRHVVEDHAIMTTQPLSVKFNLKVGGTTKAYDIPLRDPQGKPTWHFHPNPAVDLAIVRLDAPMLEREGAVFSFFRSEKDTLSRAKGKELGLSEGDGIFVLGFPMGLVGQEQDYVIVRQGTIARVRDVLDSPAATSFLADTFIFPGSSGGPVVLKPEFVSITGAPPAISNAYLIGIVSSFLSYTDIAVSTQTKRPRVTFEENSGLTQVIPADYIDETIKDLRRTEVGSPATSH